MDRPRPDRKKEIRRRRILIGLATAAGLTLVTIGLNSLEPAAREVDRASVWRDDVKRGEMLRSVRGPGTLVPVEIRWISAESNGIVEQRIVDPGATVTAGTVILELSNPELEQTVQDAELQVRAREAEHTDLEVRLQSQILDQQANLAAVKADWQGAQLQAEADQELYDNGLISDIQLRRSQLAADQLTVRHDIEQQRLAKTRESITAQLAVSTATLDQQRALFELRRQQLEDLRVKAGIDGVLQQVPVEIGQRVTPGTQLARVARPTELKAELRIAETQAKDIQVGQIARIDTRNGIVEGRVARIDPAVQQGTVTVDVSLPEDLPRGARPDLSVDGTIEIERLEDVLYMGRPAYGQPNQTIGLFKIGPDGETAQRVQVRLGKVSVNTVEVLEGLKEGDEVILTDSSQWDDVDRIRLR